MASLVASIAKIGGNSLLSRVLGFARDLVIARVFGADAATDAFFVAFKVPNLARRLFAEGAFSMALVPVLSDYRARGRESLKHFVDDMAGLLGATLMLVTGLGLLTAPILVLIFAPGFANDASQHEIATTMLRLTFPYVLFVTLTAFAGSILNTYERFGIPAFTPVLLNLVLIGCALWLAPRLDEPILALAWGILVAGIAQLALQLPFLHAEGLLPRPRLNLSDPGVRRVFGLMGPAILGVSAGQISLLLDTLLASFLQTGSISWLYYSDRLMEFPLGVLAVAVGTVIMPRLSRQHIESASGDFSRTLDWALRWVLLLGLPAAVGLLALAKPLMATLFYSSEFGSQDVVMAGSSLMAYALGVTAFMAIKVLTPGYYARQEVGTAVRIALIAILMGLACKLVLMWPLGHTGLALTTSMTAFVNAALLLRGLMHRGIYRPGPGWAPLFVKGIASTAAMAGLLVFGAGSAEDWIAMSTQARILQLGGWILAGAALYVAVLGALKMRPADFARP